MISKILKKLEDPERPLLGPNIFWLKFWGLLLPEKTIPKYVYLFLHLLVLIFALTEIIEIWFVRSDFNAMLINLKVSMLAAVNIVKVTTYIVWQKDWWDVINFATRFDNLYRTYKDPESKKIIKKYTSYSRKITYFYWILVFTTVFALVIQPFLKFTSKSYRDNVRDGTEKYADVVSAWVPFDKSTLKNYLIASSFGIYATIYGGGWITSIDSNSMVLIIFFGGQMELLRCQCSRIFGDENENITEEMAKQRLIECHTMYNEIIRYARILRSILSPIMFWYMFVCSLGFCASALQITIETIPMQQFLTAEYLSFTLVQLFIYCWHGNDTYYKSLSLSRGPFESLWWLKKNKLGKEMLILTTQLEKPLIFTAGPFMSLTIPTFLSIMKGTYSYYTLLRKS